jgi:hypothetical protein
MFFFSFKLIKIMCLFFLDVGFCLLHTTLYFLDALVFSNPKSVSHPKFRQALTYSYGVEHIL